MEEQDHRVIARRMDLFHQQEEGPGMIFWHPRGFAVYQLIEEEIRGHMRAAGFSELRTPQLLDRSLWEASGHWQKFGKEMFVFEDGEQQKALKPMSCPGHIEVFNSRLRSYRDLPLRYCEFGACLRNEPSGALLGLMRTRAFVQDDAHIFCLEEQVEEEVAKFCRLLQAVYARFGFDDVAVGLSTRPAERAGEDAVWDRAEDMLAVAATSAGLDFKLQPGEGAFYGPKLEFVLRDNKGRSWQCGTIQVDLVLPERLDAAFTDTEGRRLRPVMLHQAVLGSIERFLGVLLEHYAGKLPFWLAPDQVVVASINPEQANYAEEVVADLKVAGLRAVSDVRPERPAKKVVNARALGIPCFIAVGPREMEENRVALRQDNGQSKALTLAALADFLHSKAAA
ncbi:threonine--tRNA ligase [Pelagibius litoralis]|uniref:Threonine--tRNA ligase n=1 Tax=Pelagibius litoralis TaxID=374515 RepID=A0A967C4U1_9PROT|nr:threonine--tRNA ligase [Pelagibius litoralis]NIA67346.1 threonine--tRNA ligase [Pelagibius litoralis]